MKYLKEKFGFSLIELMVVVSIIAILMALGAVSYTTAQKKARDARRKNDIKATQDAFEQYYSSTGSGSYSATCASMATADIMAAGLPLDPKNVSPNVYTFTCTTSTYCACALLESDSGNASNATCTFGAGNYFCVKNMQ